MQEKNFLWKASSWAFALLLVLPILAIIKTALGDTDDVFSHLLNTVMGSYLWNTFSVVSLTLTLALLFGLPSAWLMAMCRIPGASILQWALVLPMAMPSYIVAYVYTDWFDFAGPVQIWLRDWFGWQSMHDYYFPDIRSIGGASLVLALVLFPYVYLLARSAFMEQSASLLHSARILKCSPLRSFWRLSLPMARPAIVVALSLVAMETIGDFGTMSYFSVPTLTTAVYDTWLGYSSITAAAKLSALMLLVIFLLLSAERFSRRKLQLFNQNATSESERYQLQGWKMYAAVIWCWTLFAAAFLLPLLQLLHYAWLYFEQSWTAEFRQYSFNSLYVSAWTATIATGIAVLVNFQRRLVATPTSVIPVRIAAMGYAVPGTVLAIGVMIVLVAADFSINSLARDMGWGRPGLLLSGTTFAMISAFVVRFSAVAIGSVESSLSKIPPSLDMAARTMGCNARRMLVRVHFPLVRRGTLIAALLVFIESMKELNAALLLRPFNFETLATYVFNFASDEQLERAALPAILLVLVGLIPLILINRSLEQK
ncbi:ABC transporter permease [Thaumasiovibrio sp. DFM-14]|uniref:ABC transporter permease n=1 Tax=Thaumasiovibrio sp. DFM-14 TaxID=3384792 RepID=UPI0039A2B37B